MALLSLSPTTGKRLRSYRVQSRREVDRLLDQAQQAAGALRRVSLSRRARFLRRVAATLRAQAEPWAELITAEVGKPLAQSRAEIEKCAACCDYYARHGTTYLVPEHPPGAAASAHVEFAPLGVILAIMPWNFPFWQAFRAAVPAILAGNTVVLKHASNVTGCALAIEEAFHRSADKDLPQVLHVLRLPGSDVPALIADPRIRGVTLTGSTAAGKAVAAAAGQALKPGVFELGGSDPYLIFEDADLDLAVERCVAGRLVNAGQSCVAAKRFIVVGRIQAAFERAFTAAMAAARVGDPRDPATQVGPLARADLREELHDQVRRSVAAGARLLLGGNLPVGPGFFYPPTVLGRVKPGNPAFDEELFGPVAAIIPARDEAHALQLANRSVYGLGSAVFTRSTARARRVTAALDAGMVFVNDFVRSDVHLPFGGTKESGFGRELARWGAQSFVNAKTVWVAP